MDRSWFTAHPETIWFPIAAQVLVSQPGTGHLCDPTLSSYELNHVRQHKLYAELLDNAKISLRISAAQDRWLSVDELAGYLWVLRDTVYKWITRRRMPAH